MTTQTVPRLGLRPDESAAVIGSDKLFEEMRTAGWIKPVVERHKLVLFDYADLVACWTRVTAGELPPTINRSPKAAS